MVLTRSVAEFAAAVEEVGTGPTDALTNLAEHRRQIRIVVSVDGEVVREIERECDGFSEGLSTGMVNGRPRADGQEAKGQFTAIWWRDVE